MRRTPVIAALLGLGLLSGCAINKGTAMADEFDERWAGTADVAEVKTSDDNPLPFAGSASGELVVAEGTPADRVIQLAEELQQYIADRDDVTGRITADGITFSVVAQPERNAEVLPLWQSLAADERVRDADLGDTTTGQVIRRRLRVTTVDPNVVMDLFQDMLSEGGRHAPLPDVRSLGVGSDFKERPVLFLETDNDGQYPEQGIAAYEAVADRFEVVDARVRASLETGTQVTIVVAADADPVEAAEVARAAAPSLSGAIKVTAART